MTEDQNVDLQQTLARLAAEARMLGGILSASADHIYLFDAAGRYLFANAAGAAALGLKPAEILSKPTRLTDLEFSLIKNHSEQGYQMLKDIDFPWPVAEIVYQHHERCDGSGYPRGLKGDEIRMEAKIIAVADVVEAMSSHRPYRPSRGIEAALEEIRKQRGVLYEAAVDACLRLFREKGYELKK